MNLKPLVCPLVCLAFCTAAQAAGSGTVTFTGAVSVPTCNYSVNGGTRSNGIVVLPAVVDRSLVLTGATAGEARFTVALTGCGGESGAMVHTRFYSPAHAGEDGRLIKISGSGAGWDYELLPARGNKPHMLARSSVAQAGKDAGAGIRGSDATLTYRVRHHRRPEAFHSGSIRTGAVYVMEYQ